MTWADVKAKIEKDGVKDTDAVRSADIYFSLERAYFTRWKLEPPPERTKSNIQEA